jgi:DNA ligase-1
MGKILIGIPSKTGEILSLSKVGSGFSEKLIKEMVARCKKLEVAKKPKNYHVDKQLEPDIWIVPEMVIEIRADSVSRSPIYTTGLSLRFPRFIRFRDDKSPQDATSKEELQKMIKLITK